MEFNFLVEVDYMNKRVVITGLGIISSIGSGKKDFLKGLREGKNGVKEVPYFDMSQYKVNRGAIVEGFDKKSYTTKNNKVETAPTNVYGLYAAKEAFEDANLSADSYPRERKGVALSTSLGSIALKTETHRQFLKNKNYENIFLDSAFEACSTLTGVICKEYDCLGPNLTVSTACAAGTNSIGCGYDMIKNNECDMVITGGVDPFSELSYSGFLSLLTLTKKIMAPFDENRSGIDIGEGAGVLILEDLDSALARNAKIYAEILGYGISNDAYHATSPDPNAGGAIRSMKLSLQSANIMPEDIDYINAHGTGTRLNDNMELKAITEVFGEDASKVPISSTKSMHGHMLGSTGSIEAIICTLAIDNNFIPATINTSQIMQAYKDYNIIIEKSIEKRINIALSSSFAFAGNTASIVIGRFN